MVVGSIGIVSVLSIEVVKRMVAGSSRSPRFQTDLTRSPAIGSGVVEKVASHSYRFRFNQTVVREVDVDRSIVKPSSDASIPLNRPRNHASSILPLLGGGPEVLAELIVA